MLETLSQLLITEQIKHGDLGGLYLIVGMIGFPIPMLYDMYFSKEKRAFGENSTPYMVYFVSFCLIVAIFHSLAPKPEITFSDNLYAKYNHKNKVYDVFTRNSLESSSKNSKKNQDITKTESAFEFSGFIKCKYLNHDKQPWECFKRLSQLREEEVLRLINKTQ